MKMDSFKYDVMTNTIMDSVTKKNDMVLGNLYMFLDFGFVGLFPLKSCRHHYGASAPISQHILFQALHL